MKFYIDYNSTTGEILGFLIDEAKKQETLKEVTKTVFEREMNTTNNNKIVIDGTNISFSKVDFRTQSEKDAEQKAIDDQNKITQLNNLIIIISTAKRFYADPESRTDLMATIIEAQEQGAVATSVTSWKTPDGIMNVTLAELKEANKLALETKAQIIGVV